ncbi:MAG: hypothetical protein DWQ31_02110 [Planctomycetota bacterium]|nr:MAG: hypothetical protein DWQ31_02110 [Planctomycetota bacterium]REJ95393.1 MAG: hypothetical protein DWQ35_06605 [Planctomycetota bacterium]REK17593.1 MAG: hypothetical protein DWQ42_22315 [Planctomycetota bacterium]REK39816.1 MAG: hypothetical protein DWQ46_17415 [Planctomycetota bacterium]
MTPSSNTARLKEFLLSPFATYIAFSGLSFFLVLGLTTLFVEIVDLGENLGFLIPLVIVFFLNFLACRYFIYRNPHDSIVGQFIRFSISAIGFRVAEYLTYSLLVTYFGLWYFGVMIVVLPTSFVVKYLYFKVIVFRIKRDRPAVAPAAADEEAVPLASGADEIR